MSSSRSAALLLLFAATAARAEQPSPRTTGQPIVVNLADISWVTPRGEGFPPGIQGSPISQDAKGGGSVGYARIPKGKEFPLHWHSHAEQTIVITGSGRFTLEGKDYPVGPGSYVDVPAKARHAFTCSAAGEDCIIITRRTGPVDFHWEKQK